MELAGKATRLSPEAHGTRESGFHPRWAAPHTSACNSGKKRTDLHAEAILFCETSPKPLFHPSSQGRQGSMKTNETFLRVDPNIQRGVGALLRRQNSLSPGKECNPRERIISTSTTHDLSGKDPRIIPQLTSTKSGHALGCDSMPDCGCCCTCDKPTPARVLECMLSTVAYGNPRFPPGGMLLVCSAYRSWTGFMKG